LGPWSLWVVVCHNGMLGEDVIENKKVFKVYAKMV
jgi:hypothetical protein